ncbi:cleavage and polyadenylation specificity factor subunit 1 protein [Dioscorea alata]|uniref:Cleavage and polyadenylation specificity factor subunit 1 protein n=1 Tax=Dioscorea alata TaxID=55571 RepID=A0ACB7UVI9_DIOAL|nr:cleavage and polyadenylation specificity factor subunit 1 protein [Dioscorea alata]
MTYAGFKILHPATGIENCASGFVTHSPSESVPKIAVVQSGDDLEAEWPARRSLGAVPNLIVTAGNILEVYVVRVQEDDARSSQPSADPRGSGGVMDGIRGARLELVCHYRLHGNVESMAILSVGGDDQSKRRDSIVLAFRDAKISVLEYDDAAHGLRTSSMHCFEGPEWRYLKRGRESFDRGPRVKADPLGRCGGVLLYGLQMIILKAAQAGQGLVGEDELAGVGSNVSVRVESSYIIDLRDLDMKHVKDFTFIHGYIEPVMVILQEKEPSWAGRIPWKHSTCMISAISISTALKQHPPLIWSAANLPYDAYKLVPVPPPIGGVLVICANSIHYHSQESVSCALVLNGFYVQSESSSEMLKSNFSVELDAAHAAWLSYDVAILTTKTGELLLLTLVYDGRAVQRLDLMKSKASVLTSGIATIGNSFFFLGSRLGDSLLVQYSHGSSIMTSSHAKDEGADIEGDGSSGKPLRRSSSDVLQDVASGEELSLYSTAPNSSESAQKISYAVRDSLINIGPLKDFSYGYRINADLNATGITKQSNYELVCCSGHGKNGAVCVLQQSIRPESITQVELPGCKGIWTVYHKSSRGHTTDPSKITTEDDEYHAYLIISMESRTMVLETADDLGEVTERVDYYVQGSTIAAGNLFGRRRVVQIYGRGARILDGSYMTQELNFVVQNSEPASNSDSFTVSFVSIADPYVLVKMVDGSIQLLVGDPSTCTMSVNVPPIATSNEPISACTLYHDKGPEPWLRKTSTDAWLSSGVAEAVDGNDGLYQFQGDIYCLICYVSGRLDIYEVPSFRCVYSVDNFISGKTHLVDKHIRAPSWNLLKIKNKNLEETTGQQRKEPAQSMRITELAMHRWPGQYSRPFLFAILNDGTMLCYHAYLYEGAEGANKVEDGLSPHDSVDLSGAGTSRLRNLRFLRVAIDTMTREEPSDVVSGPRMTIFTNVGGYQGFFLTGSRPAWVFVSRERLRVHPQRCDGPIVAFTNLHNVNCNHGLIYVTSQGLLKICQLPTAFSYDNYWPVQKVPLKATPHQIAYFAEKNLYPLILSVPVVKPLNQVLSSMIDQDIGYQMDRDKLTDDSHKTCTIDEFEVRIMEPEKSSGRWETRATIPMQNFEHALTLRVVTLLNTTTMENEVLLAIGTAYVQGEDVAARGRVLLYSIGKNTENPDNLVSEVYSKELKGAISALASLQGHLLIASGPKIILHKWTGAELNGVAFYDAPLHVVSMNIVKNFVLLGDIHKSIYFLNWKEQGAQLTMLSKDFGSLDCYATEFLIDGTQLSMVVSDDQKNIQIFYYAPKSPESWKGQKLLSRAEFHAGAHVMKFWRLQMSPNASDRTPASVASEKSNRFALLFCTLDGSIGCVAALDELTFRRLQTLQRKLVDAIPHVCGLNPRSFRQFHSNGKVHRPGPDNMIDCELLSEYEMMSLEEQLDIAHQIGTTRAQILLNLTDLSHGTSFL